MDLISGLILNMSTRLWVVGLEVIKVSPPLYWVVRWLVRLLPYLLLKIFALPVEVATIGVVYALDLMSVFSEMNEK